MIYAAYDSISIDRNLGPFRLIFSIEPSRLADHQRPPESVTGWTEDECLGMRRTPLDETPSHLVGLGNVITRNNCRTLRADHLNY